MFTNFESTINKWNKVQSLLSALESMFFAEDFRKSQPQKAFKFKNIVKDFVKNIKLKEGHQEHQVVLRKRRDRVASA